MACLAVFAFAVPAQADVVNVGETYDAAILAFASGNGGGAAGAYIQGTGNLAVGTAGTLTGGVGGSPNVTVTTTEVDNGGGNFDIVIDVTTDDGLGFLAPGIAFGGGTVEINNWGLVLGNLPFFGPPTVNPADALSLTNVASINSASGDWFVDAGSVTGPIDYLAALQTDTVGLDVSGLFVLGVPDGVDPATFEAAASLGDIAPIDQFTLTINVTAVPEPSSALAFAFCGLGLVFRRRN